MTNVSALALLLIGGVCWVGVANAQVTNTEIVFFDGGYMGWSNAYSTGSYSVQWANDLDTGGWSGSYGHLQQGSVTNPLITVAVPLFYRVVSSPNPSGPPVQTNFLTLTNPASIGMDQLLFGFSSPGGEPLFAIQSLNGSTVSLTYAATPGTVADTLVYLVSDASGNVATGRLFISINQAPTANNINTNTLEEKPVNIPVVKLNSDADGRPFACVSFTVPDHGAVAGSLPTNTVGWTNLVYTPATNYFGTDTFSYVMADVQGARNTGAVRVAVQQVFDPPTAVNIQTSTSENVYFDIPIHALNSDPDGHEFGGWTSQVFQTSNSYVNGFSNNAVGWEVLRFTPTNHFYGTNSFPYAMIDAAGLSNTGRISVNVRYTNSPLIAVNDEASTMSETPIAIYVLTNDVNPYAWVRSLSIVTNSKPANGVVTLIDGKTALYYTPTGGAARTWIDKFTYVVSDGARSGTATVSVMAGNLFVIISVGAGPSASAYPVSFTNALPDGWVTNDACKTTNIIMALIPAGTFILGSPTNECGHIDGGPYTESQRSVTITQSFYMSIFEITQKQYERVMGTNVSAWTNLSPSLNEKRPVEQVTWFNVRGGTVHGAMDTNSFTGRLTARTGFANDLPWESEWEYACRAGTTSAYNDGTCSLQTNCAECGQPGSSPLVCSNLQQMAWYVDNYDIENPGTHEVGLKKANALGLYDMHGGVSEWCDEIIEGNPTYRVIKSGSFIDSAILVRSACRSYSTAANRTSIRGFRIVLR